VQDNEKVIAYKGMDMDMKCRGYQYEVGKEYEEEKSELCKPGFHACEYPLAVFDYYPPNSSRYFAVEQSGEIKTDGAKTASTKIKIGAEIGIPGLVKAAIEYTRSRCEPKKSEHATGNLGAASATGIGCVAIATGISGKAKGTAGNAICIVERGDWDGKTYPIKNIYSAIVDGEKIKENVYYMLKDGKLVEVE